MDSEHRHELKTNELAEGISNLPTLVKENANMIIGTVLILLGLVSWWILPKMKHKKEVAEQTAMTQAIQMLEQDMVNVLRAQQAEDTSDEEALNTLLVNAESLLDQASDADNPNLQALALIKAAQALRTELHFRKESDPATAEAQINEARDAYEKAAEVADVPTLKAMAQLGLGLCSEELGQFAQAGEIYSGIVAEESFKATAIYKLAQQRLDALDENSETFTFIETPKPLVPLKMPENVTITETPEINGDNAPVDNPEATEQPETIEQNTEATAE